MRKPITLLVLLLLASVQVVFAQQTITGVVVSSVDNSALVGVSVQVKGTNTGGITDANGKYSVTVPNDQAVLIFSYIGFEPEEIEVGGQSVINVTLDEAVTLVSEIVVTALGIKREEKSLGYAVTSVNPDEMLKSKTINMMESLEGSVSGLNITPPAAGAGSSTQIRLRGQAAFQGANNSPLIVINGLPIDQGAQGVNGIAEQRDLGDNMNSINPEDIESMTVLKGATAAAIYGSRAANGAIIITTKSGVKNQGIGVEYSGSYTALQPLNYMDDIQYIYGQGRFGVKPTSASDAATTGQFGWGAKMDGELVPIFDGSMQPYSPSKDNLFKYYRTGNVKVHTIAFSGGNEKGSFRASYSRTDADGIDPYNEYKKNIGNFGANYDITDKLNFSINVNYTNEKFINPPEIGVQGPGAVNFFTRLSSSIPYSALKNSATDPVKGTEAQTSGFQGTVLNPIYAYGDAGQRYERTNDRYLTTATLRYDITSWLYAQGRFNYDYSLTHTESKVPGGIGTSQPLNTDGSYKGTYNVREGWGTDVNADFLIGANKTFNKLSVNASFGGNTFRVLNHSFNQTVTNFLIRDFFSIPNGTNQTQEYDFDESRVNSLYGLAEFGYNSTFYLNFTGRTDWFSVLGASDNSKFYPSVSGSIVFSEFLKDYDWLTFGKLRGSWAQVGSANGVNVYEGNLSYTIDNNPFNGQTLARIAQIISPNQTLQPFTVTEKEIGLDVRFFRNKLHIDIAAFDKLTTDQIISIQLSTAAGFATSKKNLGSLKNQGIETMIEYTPVEIGYFKWMTSWNNTYLKTEVLSVGKNSDGSKIEDLLVINFNGTGNEFLGELHYTVGKPMNMLYTKTYDRNENGDIIVRSNGRLQASANYVPVGSSIPKFTGGWNNSFTYKNLTLGIFIDYKLGGTILSSTNLNLTRQGFSKLSLEGRREGETGLVFPGVYDANPDPAIVDWQPNTTAVTDLQGFYGDYRNLQIGDPFTFKSDFVKLRTISISYDISNNVSKVKFLSFVKGLVLTATCRNVAILYKDIKNLDPEAIQSSGDMRAGYENASLPTTRNFTFSINAKF